MIVIENVSDRDKFCLICNEHKDDCMNVKLSVKDDNCCFATFCLCGEHRKELADKLRGAEE